MTNPFNHLLTQGFVNGIKSDTVIFYNRKKRILRKIIDQGTICDFPGIANEDLVLSYYEGSNISPVTRYEYSCERYDKEGHPFIMYWTVQPDGRYYADADGFGAEHQTEIRLYAFIDDEGRFEGPFRIHTIDSTRFMGTDMEKQYKEKFDGRKRERGELSPGQLVEREIPKLRTMFLEIMPKTWMEWKGGATLKHTIPGTDYVVNLRFFLTDRYSISLGVYREFSDRMVTNYIYAAAEPEEVADWLQKQESINQFRETINHLIEKV